MSKKKILIIDDTDLMIKIISDALLGEGYDVVWAKDGETGIQKVTSENPSLVLLDIVMPGMNGFEVCKRLRADDSNNLLPIIMLTAEDDEDAKLEGLEMGADDYIIKPFNPRELVSRVRNTLVRIDKNRWANPLTGLQGNIEIQTEITRRISSKQVFAVLYADLDNFKAYNDVYGYANGDRAIKLTADIIKDNVHIFGTPNDFIGHVGGDDFIIITVPSHVDGICEGIIADFDDKISGLYSQEDKKSGYITTVNRQGQEMKFPIITISIGVVTNAHRPLENHIQVAEIAAELKKKAKSIEGSIFIKDRRTS